MDKISIITSLYKSENYIEQFYYNYLNVFKNIQVDYEFIFVDDGSPDFSVQEVKKLLNIDGKIQLIELARNFGQYPAMFAGLTKATGNLIYTIDSDLEEDPQNLILMYKILLNEPNLDVVYGVLSQRNSDFINGYLGKIFYKILNFISDIRIPENQTWQRLMRFNFVESLLLHKEYESFPAGLSAITGYNQRFITVEKKFKGVSSYNFKKRLIYALNGLISFSSKPLVYISIFGFFIAFCSLLLIFYIIFSKLLKFRSKLSGIFIRTF